MVRNRALIVFPFLLLMTIFTSCNKNVHKGNPATVQVFNAMDNGLSLYANLSGNHPVVYRTSLLLSNKFYDLRNNLLLIDKFPQHIDLYAVPDTLPKDKPLISIPGDLKAGEIYSLFLHGEKSGAAYLLFKDLIPPINREDSTTHIRFANFSSTQPISVNIMGEPNGSFIQNLPFKSLSDFVELDADMSTPDYTFEVRDQATGNLLTSFTTSGLNPGTSWPGTVNNWIFRSNTLVFTGKPGAGYPNMQMITVMNHR